MCQSRLPYPLSPDDRSIPVPNCGPRSRYDEGAGSSWHDWGWGCWPTEGGRSLAAQRGYYYQKTTQAGVTPEYVVTPGVGVTSGIGVTSEIDVTQGSGVTPNRVGVTQWTGVTQGTGVPPLACVMREAGKKCSASGMPWWMIIPDYISVIVTIVRQPFVLARDLPLLFVTQVNSDLSPGQVSRASINRPAISVILSRNLACASAISFTNVSLLCVSILFAPSVYFLIPLYLEISRRNEFLSLYSRL